MNERSPNGVGLKIEDLPPLKLAKSPPSISLNGNEVTPLVHRAGRAPTQAAITKWLRSAKAAGYTQAWVHCPDGTKLELKLQAEEAEGDTWADVA